MRNLLRTGGSGVLLLLIMLGGGLVLWVGVPVGWLYIGSQVQAETHSLGAALAAMFVGVLVSIFVIVPVLGWLNLKHQDLREARGLESHGNTALEAVMTISAVIAVVGFGIWFFLIEGPGPMLAPR
jgi:heme/copper-type cytochrome/quinol oxidase subunit 2